MISLNSKNTIIIVALLFVILMVLYFPKIYLRNTIYYISRDINKLYVYHISLKEENKFLKQQLEDMKFKNQIMDVLLIENTKK